MKLLPTRRLRAALFAPALAIAVAGLAAPPVLAADQAAPAAAKSPPPQMVFLRVKVGADGKVTSSTSLDPNAAPVLVQAAQSVATKLNFSPATKDGRAVASETTLVLNLAFLPQAGGGFGVSVLRAHSGPNAVQVGTFQEPKVGKRENGGVITVGADLRADGTVDMETYKVEKAELRVPATFAQEQFEKSARHAMKDARFQLDKVDGIEIPLRVSVPFSFNGGAGMAKPGEDEEGGKAGKGARPPAPLISATSRIEGIVLPKIDYTAPAQ